jgi:hypothetical protein
MGREAREAVLRLRTGRVAASRLVLDDTMAVWTFIPEKP